MNEVTRIHLGRQPFTVSVEAHKALRAYLANIEKHVGDPDVLNEVELRMSELLTERGIYGEKVVLQDDVDYLMKQLGSPKDFSDEAADTDEPAPTDKVGKRLFRDTDNALIAGVASGLANFFNLDVTLVRLLFVLLVIFSAGFGFVLYIMLWLIVPAAETTSEKLQMRGMPVTLTALKDSVAKADVPGAARRVNGAILPVINSLFRIGVKLVGVGFILAGLGLLASAAVTKMYAVLHNGQLFQEHLFPVGIREEWLFNLGLLLTALLAVFFGLVGIATIKRKWPLRGWITGLLVGLFLIGSTATVALAADAAPRIEQRYESGLHTTALQNIQPFTHIDAKGIDVAYVPSPTYAANLHYYGNLDVSKITAHVENDTLYVDATQLDVTKHCDMLCLFPKYNLTVEVFAPNVVASDSSSHRVIFYPGPNQ